MIPPWQDIETLAVNICQSRNTVLNWVEQGILPPARKRGGKLMWKWAEVDEWLTNGNDNRLRPGSIADAVRKAVGQ